jgi:serine-type D-Ala-D-Ala carboxypeptidase/endopeptidase
MLKIIGIIVLVIAVLLAILYAFIMNRVNSIRDSSQNMEESIDNIMEASIKEQQLIGVVVGIVQPNSTLIRGYGTMRAGANITPDGSTMFELASIGKLFTTAAVQIGVNGNDFDWDDPIAKRLSSKIQMPISCKATLRNLATHTSGMPALPSNFLEKMTDEQNPYKNLSINDLYDYLTTCKEDKKIGEYEYSNFGMGVLGHILELKYRKKYEDIIKDEICAPLAMHNTTIALSPTQKAQLAQGYDEKGQPTPIWQDTVLAGAGSFLSNAEDMVKFIQANLDEANSTISPQLMACHAPQMKGETGLGWHIEDVIMSKQIWWHNGGTGGYSSYIAIDKNSKSGCIILSNSAKDITEIGKMLMLMLMIGRTAPKK